MDPFTIGSLIAGGIGGLFGKGKTNKYGTQIAQNADTLGSVRDQYGENATAAQANYNTYAPKQFGAIDDYADLLSKDPYTDSNSTRALAGATAGTDAAYNSANANLAASMARRGITGSSADIGGSAAIEAARAGTYANAQNVLAAQKIASNDERLQKLVGLYGNTAQQERGAANQALGAQAGVAGNLLDSYIGMNNASNAEAAANDASLTNGLGALGGVVGTALGGRSATPVGFGTGTGTIPGFTPPIAPTNGNQATWDALLSQDTPTNRLILQYLRTGKAG